jgi:hypothetical protein
LKLQNLAHFTMLSWPGPPPPPLPAQTTRQLAVEVATTSQMLLANTIFESFLAKYSIWLCSGFSVAQNGHFLRQGASTIWFFVNHFVPLLPRLRICLDQLRLAVPPRGASDLQPLALLRSSSGTNQNFCLVTSNLRLRRINARIFVVLVNTLYVGDTSRAITYVLCAIHWMADRLDSCLVGHGCRGWGSWDCVSITLNSHTSL